MFSRVAFGMLALSAVLTAPGIVAAKPVTGNVSCTLKGSSTVSPGLPFTGTTLTKPLKTKVTFTGTLSNCTGTQTGTKGGLQIDGGTLSAKGVIKTPAG